ncbi:MAG: transketolase [Patescibacteria group bacterium]
MPENNLKEIAKLIRYNILKSTTVAGSGHPTSSLSAADIMTVLMFGGYFRTQLDDPNYENNDRLIFSKGHAAPLLYSLYSAAGMLSQEELVTLRKFGSQLEGHPTMEFPFTEAATGSLGQGLAIGLGMALNAKHESLDYNTYVLLGDSEVAEGSVWESMHIASHYKLNNLIGIIDVNRLGQRGQTIDGWNLDNYKLKCESFDWESYVVDGHNFEAIGNVLVSILESTTDKPKMIIAKTLKGSGISFLEDKDNWHGKALSQDKYEQAIAELGDVDTNLIGEVSHPNNIRWVKTHVSDVQQLPTSNYSLGDMIATRKAYGQSLAKLGDTVSEVVALDAETSNSTFASIFRDKFPMRFFEMFIAEQNMVGAALGLARRGKIPFISTFAAFFSRAYDQIRMSQYSGSNIKFVGSHAGVSIGVDGSSQMALEDIAMMRAISNMVVFYPSDAVSTEKIVSEAANLTGNVYIRTTRAETPIIYENNEEFVVSGSKILRQSTKDIVTVIGAGITLHESLKAYDQLKDQGITIRVVDLYCVKPVDKSMLRQISADTKSIIVVEDHYLQGGIFGAVTEALAEEGILIPTQSLSVRKMPRSGTPEELLKYEEIDSQAIVDLVIKTIN